MATFAGDGLLYTKDSTCGMLCFIIDHGDPVCINFFQKIKVEVVLGHTITQKEYGGQANEMHHKSVVERNEEMEEDASSMETTAYPFEIAAEQEVIGVQSEPAKGEEADVKDNSENIHLEVRISEVPEIGKIQEVDVISHDKVTESSKIKVIEASKIKDLDKKNKFRTRTQVSGNDKDDILNHGYNQDGGTTHRVLRSKKNKLGESKKPRAEKKKGKGKPANKISVSQLIHSPLNKGKKPLKAESEKKAGSNVKSEKEIEKTKLNSGSKWQTACEISCQYCLKVFENQQAFYDHKKTPRSEVHTCEICQKNFPFKAFLQAHVRAYHSDDQVFSNLKESESCICDVCGSEVKNMFALKKHLMFHTNEYFYKCCICGKKFIEPGTLNNHMATHKSGGMVRCRCCNELFATRGALAKHKLALMEVKCHLCDLSFPNRTSRTQHYKLFHQSDILKCSKCTNMFSSQEELVVHMKKHNSYKKKQCTTCGKFFSRLEKHIITHKSKAEIDESELFVCDKCPRKFSNRSSFQRHLTIHSQDKPYQCPNCPRTFADCGVLRKHLRRHSSLMPYECEVCGKKCKEPGNLKVHMRIHSDTKQFPCPICPQAFNYKSSLEGHMRSRHSQNLNAVIHTSVVQPSESTQTNKKRAEVDGDLDYEAAIDTSIKQTYGETSVFVKPVNLMSRHVFQNHTVPTNQSDADIAPKNLYSGDSVTDSLNVTSLDVTTVNVSTMNVSLY